MDERLYPIAEIFESIQGEGHWVGVPMIFLRFAGCSVGKYSLGPGEPPVCHTFAIPMLCDTNYKVHERRTREELLHASTLNHVCLTGGEPADHDLTDLLYALHERHSRAFVHLETSGTKDPAWLKDVDWIACSPKKNFKYEVLDQAHEIRFLINNSEKAMDQAIRILNIIENLKHPLQQQIFVSPVNPVPSPGSASKHTISDETLKAAIEVARSLWLYNVRISVQLHKYLNMR